MKRWRLLEKKRKHWYFVNYRMDKEKDGYSLNHFEGSCSVSDNKIWTDVDAELIGKTILDANFTDKHKYGDYKITVLGVSKL